MPSCSHELPWATMLLKIIVVFSPALDKFVLELNKVNDQCVFQKAAAVFFPEIIFLLSKESYCI